MHGKQTEESLKEAGEQFDVGNLYSQPYFAHSIFMFQTWRFWYYVTLHMIEKKVGAGDDIGMEIFIDKSVKCPIKLRVVVWLLPSSRFIASGS